MTKRSTSLRITSRLPLTFQREWLHRATQPTCKHEKVGIREKMLSTGIGDYFASHVKDEQTLFVQLLLVL